jgi:hypothetical protein
VCGELSGAVLAAAAAGGACGRSAWRRGSALTPRPAVGHLLSLNPSSAVGLGLPGSRCQIARLRSRQGKARHDHECSELKQKTI